MAAHKWLSVSSFILISLKFVSGDMHKFDSHFGLPVQSVTVNVGQTARLTCFVQTPGDHMVAWMNKVTNAVLSMGETVIAKDSRMSVKREQRSTWILTIRNVTIQDHGYYSCNINTQPPTSIHGYLNVVEPPVLDDKEEEEMHVMEGMMAFLTCDAHGTPTPTFKWIREDHNNIRFNSSTYLSSWSGRNLSLEHTNHQSAGDYLCIASNGYPPSKSRRVRLFIYFTPFVKGPGRQIWASIGDSVTLTCLYAAYPVPKVTWILENHLGPRYFTQEYFTNTPQEGQEPYTHSMTLKILKLTSTDFGRYTCLITNSEGEASYTTTLREITTTTALPPLPTKMVTAALRTTLIKESSESPTSEKPFSKYYEEMANLSAPLIINFTPVDKRADGNGAIRSAYPVFSVCTLSLLLIT